MNWASALRPCGHAELDIWSEASADNCPQERSCSRYCRNSKHNWLLRSWFQRSIFLTPFKERKRKKKKKKNPKGHRTGCSASWIITGAVIKMTTRNQVLSDRMAILSANCREERARRWWNTPFMFSVNTHWQQPLEGTVSRIATDQSKKFQER